MSFKGAIGDVVEIGRGDGEMSSFEWRIPDFPSLAGEGGEYYESPVFDACGGRWCFRIYPNGMSRDAPSDWMSLHLFRQDLGQPQTLDVRLGIRSSEGVENKKGRRQEFSYDDDRVCSWCTFYSRSKLIEHKSVLMPGNVLIVSLDMKSVVHNVARVLISTDSAPSVIDNSVHLQRLSDDFSRLLNEVIEPDATVTCGNRTWRVHRSILSVRSEVFAAMFRSGMVESHTGAVRVEDVEASILDSILKYIYCGKVPEMSGEDVSSVYEAADRYALHGLRKGCSDWMVGSLSVENCLSFLVTADAHGDAELKAAAVSFITEHFSQLECAVWKNFAKEHSTLAIEVLQRFAPSLKE